MPLNWGVRYHLTRSVYGRWISEVDPAAGQKIKQLFCDRPVTKLSPNYTNSDQALILKKIGEILEDPAYSEVWSGLDKIEVLRKMVEAAGIEPASANPPPLALHAYPTLLI